MNSVLSVRSSLLFRSNKRGKRSYFCFGEPIEQVLSMVEGLEVEMIESSCCGMAGAFGYDASTYDVSMRMAEENLLPKVRVSKDSDIIIADGTSCRCQIEHGTSRKALHVAQLLDQSLSADTTI